MSRLLIVNRAGKAYSGKEVVLIAGELMSMRVLMNVYIYLCICMSNGVGSTVFVMQVERVLFDCYRVGEC
jgi:hypothetical protein